ncbi:MAG: 4Fe-4S binding protein [Clostridiales bacterium]|jgi:2-oxoglutarate ferredoxin oxidoreductase subunit delta|nr:4Fe-4S binding protein [Clostridiales bacterium]
MIKFDKQSCKGCSLCVESCPKKILELSKTEINDKGYYVAECVNQTACISCAFCAVICPDSVISVIK